MTDLIVNSSKDVDLEIFSTTVTEFLDTSEIIERIESGELKYLPEELYIRGTLNSLDDCKKALKIKEQMDDEINIKILHPITIIDRDGQSYILNGNSRIRSLVELWNQKEESDERATFYPVPVFYITDDLTDTQIIQYQRLSNDTTQRHTVLQNALMAVELNKANYALYIKNGYGESKAKQQAARDVQTALEVSAATTTKVLKVAEVANTSSFLRAIIESGQLSLDNAYDILALVKKAQNKNSDTTITLEFALLSIRAIAENDNSFVNGLYKIERNHIATFKESLGVSKKKVDIEADDDSDDSELSTKSSSSSKISLEPMDINILKKSSDEFLDNIGELEKLPSSSLINKKSQISEFNKKGLQLVIEIAKNYDASHDQELFNILNGLLKEWMVDLPELVEQTPDDIRKVNSLLDGLNKASLSIINEPKAKGKKVDEKVEELEVEEVQEVKTKTKTKEVKEPKVRGRKAKAKAEAEVIEVKEVELIEDDEDIEEQEDEDLNDDAKLFVSDF